MFNYEFRVKVFSLSGEFLEVDHYSEWAESSEDAQMKIEDEILPVYYQDMDDYEFEFELINVTG